MRRGGLKFGSSSWSVLSAWTTAFAVSMEMLQPGTLVVAATVRKAAFVPLRHFESVEMSDMLDSKISMLGLSIAAGNSL